MMTITPTVKQLLIINVLFFLGSNFIGNVNINYQYLSLYNFGNPNFKIYQFFTHMFMHSQYPDISHIAFNMLGLYSIGSALEHFWGSKRFLFFYLTCGLSAGLISNLVDFYVFHNYLGYAVGASGAIYGLLVAFAFMLPNAELSLMFIPVPIKAKYFVPLYMFLYDGAFGIFGNAMIGVSSGVGHFAHIGGALTGAILMIIWRNNKFKHNRWD
jgi:membrane associated rhomboid family serine protease